MHIKFCYDFVLHIIWLLIIHYSTSDDSGIPKSVMADDAYIPMQLIM